MNTYTSLSDYVPDKSSVVSVGNFDGVHRGHALLIAEVVRRAKQNNRRSVIITFHPHTRMVLAEKPEQALPILSTFKEKSLLLKNLGIDALVRLQFDDSLRNMSAQMFVDDILRSRLGAAEWVMGKGHRFGKNRAGAINSLQNKSDKNDIMIPVDLTVHDKRPVSSTEIRTLLTGGEIGQAVELLGHPYLIIVRRTTGKKIGSSLGFPTLNFEKAAPEKVLPPAGVYAAELVYGPSRFSGALYFGDCPTFEKREAHFEFHCFADPGNAVPPVGGHGELWVHAFIRPDKSFRNPDELKTGIAQDITTIKQFFSRE